MPDIDIDFADRQKILDVLPHTRATIWDDKGIKAHNTGVYFVDVPTIPGTDQSAFDHKVADQLGYFKLDFLNVNILFTSAIETTTSRTIRHGATMAQITRQSIC